MPQLIDLKAKGLHTHPNSLSEVPPGALIEANNVIIDKEGITETRRGFKRYGEKLNGKINSLFEYEGKLLVHHGSLISRDSNGQGAWVSYSGSYDPPPGGLSIRTAESNKNLYFTTAKGIKKLDSLNSSVVDAGGLKGLDIDWELTGSTGFLANNAKVAYRVLFGYVDKNNNKILGSPSSRTVVSNNQGASRNVILTFSIPREIKSTHFYQIYRSQQTQSLSEEPNDELQLVIEKNPTQNEIQNGVVSYTDITPSYMLGAVIYTAPSQEGILQANDPPPLALDIVQYKSMIFYANTISKHRLMINLISVGAPNGLQENDTISIAEIVYTAKTIENVDLGHFKIFLDGSPSQNIERTAKSLVKIINRYLSNNSTYAYYISGLEDLPGQILIEERLIGGQKFRAISNRGSAFNPPLPSSGDSYSSKSDVEPNAVYISKIQQPEAVPILNKIYVGSSAYGIERIVSLRDAVFIFKRNGIYRLIGDSPRDLSVVIFDNTSSILARNSVVAFNNQVYCYSDQGIIGVSDIGSIIMSRPIEHDLLKLSSPRFPYFTTTSFGVSYESDRKYLFSTVTNTTDDHPTQIYVYNYVTKTWTKWILSANCGHVLSSDGKLYLGSAKNGYIMQEKKSFSVMDYSDDEIEAELISYEEDIITLNSTENINVGDTIAKINERQIPVQKSVIVKILDNQKIVVEDKIPWILGECFIYKPIPIDIKYAPIHGGNPAMVKIFSDLIMFFSNADFSLLNIGIFSDQSHDLEMFKIESNKFGGWGLFPWGQIPWGINYSALQAIRTLIPAEKARSRWINLLISHSQALSSFALNGISVFFDEISEVSR